MEVYPTSAGLQDPDAPSLTQGARDAGACASIHTRDRRAEGPAGRGRMEFSGSGEGGDVLHTGLALAESIRIPQRSHRDHRVSSPQMGEGIGVPPDQGTLGRRRQPNSGALRLRMAGRLWPLVPLVWQRELGV